MEKKNRKVLIVEDNKLNMKLFREILIAENCEVIECADPMFAMDKISSELPNLILMDIQLPRISGYDLITWIKSDANISLCPPTTSYGYVFGKKVAKFSASNINSHFIAWYNLLCIADITRDPRSKSATVVPTAAL